MCDIFQTLINPIIARYFEFRDVTQDNPRTLTFSDVTLFLPIGPFPEGQRLAALDFELLRDGSVRTTAVIVEFIEHPGDPSIVIPNPILTQIYPENYPYEETLNEEDLTFLEIDLTASFPLRLSATLD